MSFRFTKHKLTQALTGLAILMGFIGLIAYPKEISASAQDALNLCVNTLIPSLFPFFVLSSLTVQLGLADYLGRLMERLMRPLFHVGGACAAAVALGFVGGYPVGARTAIALYEKGLCSREEVQRLLGFCNNSGPAFIFGVAGAGVFLSGKAGLLLYLSHILASITVGLMFRFYKAGPQEGMRRESRSLRVIRLGQAFTESVTGSFTGILSICAFVIFFAVIIKLLFITGIIPAASEWIASVLTPLNVDAGSVRNLMTGLLEISSGVWSLKGSEAAIQARLAMAAFMLGWAGLSVHCQVLSFISRSGLSAKTYFIGKLLHAVISALYSWWLCLLFRFEAPASEYLVRQVDAIASQDFSRSLVLSSVMAIAVWLCFLSIMAALILKKHWKKLR